MQGENKAVKYRTAHLQWLLDNNVFSLNSADEWQPELRRWTPSSSARYPLRIMTPKLPTDPDSGKITLCVRMVIEMRWGGIGWNRVWGGWNGIGTGYERNRDGMGWIVDVWHISVGTDME